MMGFVICFFVWLVGNLLPTQVFADTPHSWQMGFQEAATEIMELTAKSHHFVMLVMGVVALFVWLLMAYVVIRFRRKPGDENGQISNSHSGNAIIEIVWTIIPMIIVGILTVNNVKLINYQEKIPKIDMTLKVIGYQWYWGYSYPDHGDISFDSYMKQDSDLKPGELRLLEVDNRVVLPINTNVRVQVTGADVIHSFAVPAFGIKVDAIPGRLNEVWFNVKKPGVYRGQCSELCGRLHGFMPIVIEAVTKDEFEKWVNSKKA